LKDSFILSVIISAFWRRLDSSARWDLRNTNNATTACQLVLHSC